jgi:hypothetical protein
MKILIKPKSDNVLISKIAVCVAIITLAVFILLPVDNAHSEKTVCDFQNRDCFTETGYPACYGKVDIQKYYQFSEQGQTGLAEQLISDGARCIKLNGNEKATMMDKSSGYVKFVLRGSDKTLWAKREALYSD